MYVLPECSSICNGNKLFVVYTFQATTLSLSSMSKVYCHRLLVSIMDKFCCPLSCVLQVRSCLTKLISYRRAQRVVTCFVVTSEQIHPYSLFRHTMMQYQVICPFILGVMIENDGVIVLQSSNLPNKSHIEVVSLYGNTLVGQIKSSFD